MLHRQYEKFGLLMNSPVVAAQLGRKLVFRKPLTKPLSGIGTHNHLNSEFPLADNPLWSFEDSNLIANEIYSRANCQYGCPFLVTRPYKPLYSPRCQFHSM